MSDFRPNTFLIAYILHLQYLTERKMSDIFIGSYFSVNYASENIVTTRIRDVISKEYLGS
jgi:hypothetical protein